MDKERLDIDQLMMNDFSGRLTPDDRQLLDQWVDENRENQHKYTEQKKLWNLFTLHQKMQKIDEKRAYQKVATRLFAPKKYNFILQLQRIAAILLLPVLIVSGLYYFAAQNQSKDYSAVYTTTETPLGMRSSLILPDGTKVWLNAGSKLSYPVIFSDKFRAVSLNGEAYFEVKKNKKWPFWVSAGNMNIVVSGTAFNCNAYPENNEIQTVLVEGQVTVMNESATVSKELQAGELAVFSKRTQQISRIKTDSQKYIAWKNGKLVFKEDPMNLVVEKLERWYNVEFDIKDKEISEYIYTATFMDESLDQVLKMLSLSAPIRYSVSVRHKKEDQTFEKQTVRLYRK